MRIRRFLLTAAVLAPVLLPVFTSVVARTTSPRKHPIKIAPAIPKAKRMPSLVFLEHANELRRNEGEPYMILTGDVQFTKGGMHMRADSAHFFEETSSFDAFGNVKMEQGDTLFVYADELNYDGESEVANLFGFNGNLVRLINRDVMLRTDIFTYDLGVEIGSYATGGILTDRDNRLESIEGEYSPATKEANFYDRVILTSRRPDDELRMVSDALYYNTATHVAEFSTPTVITSKDGRIDSERGVYNTETRLAELYERSLVTTNRGSTLEGDTLFYDRAAGHGEAFGNMVLTDSVRQVTLAGNYGYYNEVTDSAYVTGRAHGMEYSKGDTLHIHARYLTMVAVVDSVPAKAPELTEIVTDTVGDAVEEISTDSIAGPVEPLLPIMVADTTHVVRAWPRVRFYRSDIQGVADSLAYTQNDTTVRLFYHPVVWSEDRQIFGNRIDVHLNDSTVDHAVLPDFGFVAMHIEDIYYNQLSGKQMTAWFDNGEMNHIYVSGNVEGIMYPEENDSTINKVVYFATSDLDGTFEGRNMKRMKLWPATTGDVTPLYLARRNELQLSKFKWYEGVRPLSPADIFVIPKEMEELMNDRPLPPDTMPVPAEAPDLDPEGVGILTVSTKDE